MTAEIPIILGRITIEQRDEYLSQLEEDISVRRRMLLNKRKEVAEKARVNNFLNGVIADYDKYYNYIISEKQKQYDAMSKLNSYLDDLQKTNRKLDTEIVETTEEQQSLLKEMEQIKVSLNEIIDKTKPE
jgi:chromosome segregation ATPase